MHQRQLRGNLPQAFVHAGVLECAVTLSRDVRLAGSRLAADASSPGGEGRVRGS